LALVAKHVLRLPATHGRVRKVTASGDGGTYEDVAKRRRV
jgi:hypothetical protein